MNTNVVYNNAAPYLDELTPRERDVLKLLARGLSNQQIAEELGISRETVKTHVSRILFKLGIGSRHDVKWIVAGMSERTLANGGAGGGES